MATTSCQSSSGNQVLGRGKVYLDIFRNGKYEGERYLGNTPSFSLSSSADKLDHYNSDSGFREKDKSIVLENSRTGSLETDDISLENVALMFAGQVYSGIQSAQSDIFEKVNFGGAVVKNRTYQLGVSDDYPQGRGAIDPASFTIGYADASIAISDGGGDISTITGVTVLPSANYELDTVTGRLYLEADAPQINGEVQLVVKYSRVAYSQDIVISSDDSIVGALRFVSDNPEGEQMSYYLPKVSIAPDGDYALKGDDWQVMSFSFDVLKRDCKTKSVYAYRTPVTSATSGPVTYSIDAAVYGPTGELITQVKPGETGSYSVVVTDATGAVVPNLAMQFSAIGATVANGAVQTNAQGNAMTGFSVPAGAQTPGTATLTVQVIGSSAIHSTQVPVVSE